MRTNKQHVRTKDHSGLSEIRFALRMYLSKSRKSPYERYVGNKPNTIKKLLINRSTTISDPVEVKLSTSDFESVQDSRILVRERVKGSKLESVYKKRKGKLPDQSEHTITFLTAGSNQKTVISKRDLANQNDQPCSSKEADRRLLETQREMADLLEILETAEVPFFNDIPEPPQTTIENNEIEQETERDIVKTNETQQKTKIKKKKTVIEQLNEKARRQQKRNIKPKLSPILETPSTINLSDSEEEEEMVRDDVQTTKIKQENDMPPRRDTIQTSQKEIRRGERNRMKTDFFGQM